MFNKLLKFGIPALFAGIMLMNAAQVAQAAPLTLPADSSKIYRVQGLTPGNVLKMYANPGSGILVNLPHNATWIVRRNNQAMVGNTLWEKVSWDTMTGWVESRRLTYDPQATAIATARRACMTNPAVADKMCCGYPETAKGIPFRSVPIFSVSGLRPGQSLMMYKEEGDGSAIAVEIPHNATWITRMGKVARAGNVAFEQVRWGGINGWVNMAYLREDPAKTREGDEKRRRCSSSGTLLPAADPEVVCLPASVIRRLRESGALPEAVLQQLSQQPK
ncbi:MAG: hypothetical protein KDI44_05680 [Thiothrix sp.]|nr:hypothetical protein [Thiothrix sp.]HPQ94337.1 hypothetical protein [Thiolinea sp.]